MDFLGNSRIILIAPQKWLPQNIVNMMIVVVNVTFTSFAVSKEARLTNAAV